MKQVRRLRVSSADRSAVFLEATWDAGELLAVSGHPAFVAGLRRRASHGFEEWCESDEEIRRTTIESPQFLERVGALLARQYDVIVSCGSVFEIEVSDVVGVTDVHKVFVQPGSAGGIRVSLAWFGPAATGPADGDTWQLWSPSGWRRAA